MEIERIGEAGWLRRDDEPTPVRPGGTVRYWLPRPNHTPGLTILVTSEGLHFASDGVQRFATDAELESLERMIVLAQRQYQDRMEHGLAPHDPEQDRALYAWLKNQ